MQRTALADSGTEDIPVSYSVPVAARLIGISPRGMWDLVRTEKIRSFWVGGRRLVSRKAIEEYVTERENAEAA